LDLHAVRGQVRTAFDALFGIAKEQRGSFTAKHAANAGFEIGVQAHQVKSRNWVRVERGVYRLVRFPQSAEHPHLNLPAWRDWLPFARFGAGNDRLKAPAHRAASQRDL
jgi:hypothetical protein